MPKSGASELDQTLGLPSDLPSGLTTEQTSGLPPDHPTCRPNDRPTSLPTIRSAVQTSVQPTCQADVRDAAQPGGQGDVRPIACLSELHPAEIYWLNDRQAQVLLLLVQESSCIVSYADISLKTGIPPESVRKITSRLLKENFITSRQQYRKGQFQGIKYSVNRAKCRIFFEARGGSFSNLPPDRTGDRTGGRPDGRMNPLSSSQSFNKSLAAKEGEFPINWEEVLTTDMDLRFWVRQGLRTGIVQGWINKYNIKPLVMLESLKHADWDLRKREREAEERKSKGEKDWDRDIVRKPIDWFHTPIRDSGYYRRPSDYKSHEDKQLEIEEQILAEKRRQQKAHLKLKLEKAFQEIITNSEGEEYQFYYSQLPLFSRNRYKLGDEMLLELLRGVYFKAHGIEYENNNR